MFQIRFCFRLENRLSNQFGWKIAALLFEKAVILINLRFTLLGFPNKKSK